MYVSVGAFTFSFVPNFHSSKEIHSAIVPKCSGALIESFLAEKNGYFS
jgi:hypothetical protein